MIEIEPTREMQVLSKARETYGNKNQILVCMEELNELACVLAKYPRYEDENKATQELFDKVLDETADVYIILEHVKAIFGFTPQQLEDRKEKKLERVERWLTHSGSMQETIEDRCVTETMCPTCKNNKESAHHYEEVCAHCLKAQATEGKAPYYQKK